MPTDFKQRWQHRLARSWWRRDWLAWLLWPLSWVYAALVALRRLLYQLHILYSRKIPVPVVVVGNVVAGGAGKTPLVIALVRHLKAAGLLVGVISRGYGRHSKGCHEVLHNTYPWALGDEPVLIKRNTGVPVFVAERRLDAVQALLVRYPKTNLIVSDDGLQHLALRRDLEICVFDDRGLGNRFLLPAGPLREPWPRPADLVLHTGSKPAFEGWHATRALAPQALNGTGQRAALLDWAMAGTPIMAVAAIAKPEDFFVMLSDLGLNLVQTLILPDHDDLSSVAPWMHDTRLTVLCTEKDAVKLWIRHPQVWAAPLVLTPEPAFLRRFDELLQRCAPALTNRR
jgi:tetraacyldisaccharide 4'-kinase